MALDHRAVELRAVGADGEQLAVVVGEYERAFYGDQLLSLAPVFEAHGVSYVDEVCW
ncbi:hypothetical protein ABT297_13910 [Dactylosporangium sp. NPDC000555]|uniref:hypothetical protein n=1 Tax=Dactylosporangium sp. NPDC000555 TaxID=3154260 RepID=UPI003318514E